MAGYDFAKRGYVGTAPGTPTIQNADGSIQQVVNVVDDQQWGSCQWANAQTTNDSVFGASGSSAIPGGTRNMTPVDNNLQRPGDNGMPQAWAQDVFSIGLQFRRAIRAAGSSPVISDYSLPPDELTVFGLNRLIYWEFRYSNRVFCQGLAEDFAAGAGQFWQGSASGIQVVNNGLPVPAGRRAMMFPISLREGITFTFVGAPASALSIAMADPANGANLTYVDMTATLRGPLQKGI